MTFENVEVPVENLIGEENQGFKCILFIPFSGLPYVVFFSFLLYFISSFSPLFFHIFFLPLKINLVLTSEILCSISTARDGESLYK